MGYQYSSPIELVTKEISVRMDESIENLITTSIKEVGVLVDKEELIKALNYDRQQYEKGYADGLNALRDKKRGYEV